MGSFEFISAMATRPRTTLQILESLQKRFPDDPEVSGWLQSIAALFQKEESWPEEVLLQTQAGIAAAAAGDVELARAQLRSALALAPVREAAVALVGLGVVPGDVTWLLPARERWPLDPVLAALEF
jgi:hypothetical protein